MLRTALITVMMAGLACTAAAENVYKWVDVRGQVHYSDRPPTEAGARVLSVSVRPTGFAEEDEAGATPAQAPAPVAGASQPDAASRAAAAAVQRDLEAIRGDKCKEAQTRYRQYIESRRLYRELPGGQREYLTDAELTQARIEAKQAVDEYCGPGGR